MLRPKRKTGELSPFRAAILTALHRVPLGYRQRIDGLRCEKGVIEVDWWFFGWRLDAMERAGLISSRRTISIWPSANGLSAYQLTDKGKEAFKAAEQKRNAL
jgi:hypothetical protein